MGAKLIIEKRWEEGNQFSFWIYDAEVKCHECNMWIPAGHNVGYCIPKYKWCMSCIEKFVLECPEQDRDWEN